MRKPKLWQRLTALATIAALVAADQLIKRWVHAAFRLSGHFSPEGEDWTLIPGVLRLTYTENTGISFSIFGDSAVAMRVVIVLTGAVMLAGLALLLLGKLEKGAQLWSAALILAGGIGNLIDRVLPWRDGVVDYLEFLFMNFAIFNFADICITCGVAWLAGYMLLGESRRRKMVAMP